MGWIITSMTVVGYLVGWVTFGGMAGRRSLARHPKRSRRDYRCDAVSAVIFLGAIWPAYLFVLGIGEGIDILLLREGDPRVTRKERKAKLRQQAEEWRQREIEEIEDRLKAARAEIRMAERQRMRDWDKRFQEMDEGIERR